MLFCPWDGSVSVAMSCLCVGLMLIGGCELLSFLMAQVCINLAVFSFMACGKLSACIMLLISSLESLTSGVFTFPLSCVIGSCFSLPLWLGLVLLVCSFSLFTRMGLSPRQFLHALHSL